MFGIHSSDLPPMIIIIVAIVALSRLARFIVQQKVVLRMKQAETFGGGQQFNERIEQLEKRLANLETIMLEHEKVREFDRALR
ncbi:TPA: hypothetical protein DDW35_05400 [Candidatus Sumerlaeota bacterium]|jgi:hypothetical protein|nr:hypothetical protein [Candidatus Sumerlaeota bacterium]